MRTSLGFWAMVVLVLLRSWSIAPALLARGPASVRYVAVAATVLVIYVANTVVTARRMRAADAATAADLVWIHGWTGLALAAVLLSLA
jgi:prepilin signal peptidase PulO-like enzyme (type II secretory pathway)